jgi:hypothetical protein
MDSGSPQARPPNSLEYAPPISLQRRVFRTFRRLAIAAILIAAIAVSIGQIRSHWPALRLYYIQHECLAHPIPTGVQLYSSAQPSAAYASPHFDALFRELGLPADFPPSSDKLVPLYLGTRQAEDGTKRFLAIFITAATTTSTGNVYDLKLFMINRPTGLAPPEEYGQGQLLEHIQWSPDIFTPSAASHILIDSAVEDRSDKSHVTVTLEVNALHYVDDLYVIPGGGIRIRRETVRSSTLSEGSVSGFTYSPGKLTPDIIPPPQ